MQHKFYRTEACGKFHTCLQSESHPQTSLELYKSTIASSKMRRVQNPRVDSRVCSGERLGYAFFHNKKQKKNNLRTNTMEHSSVAKVTPDYYSTRGTVQLKRKGVKDDLGRGGVGWVGCAEFLIW